MIQQLGCFLQALVIVAIYERGQKDEFCLAVGRILGQRLPSIRFRQRRESRQEELSCLGQNFVSAGGIGFRLSSGGRLAVVTDPFGNSLVLLDLSTGYYAVDDTGRVTGVEAMRTTGGSIADPERSASSIRAEYRPTVRPGGPFGSLGGDLRR